MTFPTYTEAQVAEHTSKEDLWLIIHDSVYNVSSYLSEHPGGDIILLQNGGEDATDLFEDNGHSEDARTLMADFKIGELATDGIPANDKSAEPCMKCRWIRIGILLAGCAVVSAIVYRKYQ